MAMGMTILLVCLGLFIHVLNAQQSLRLRLPSEDAKAEKTLNSEFYRPLIGIVTHPGDGAHGKLSTAPNASYIAASYVKFVESGGARVVPFIYNEPPEVLEQKFRAVNGLLFTGGSAKYGPYHQTVENLFQRALEENDNGEYFPVYAVCLGFEILSMIVSKDLNILERFDAANHPSTLFFESDAAKNTSIFKWFQPHILSKMSSEPLLFQNHMFGISPERMSANSGLSSFFKILTTSCDKNNKTYVSTIEAYKYPVTAVQWHPEKNTFEWEIPTIPHSADAIQVTQSVANFVISEARKSSHRATFQQEEEYLIYNYFPAYSGKVGGSFDQVYLFT
jgi:gamma-glutamyl hydrolase